MSPARARQHAALSRTELPASRFPSRTSPCRTRRTMRERRSRQRTSRPAASSTATRLQAATTPSTRLSSRARRASRDRAGEGGHGHHHREVVRHPQGVQRRGVRGRGQRHRANRRGRLAERALEQTEEQPHGAHLGQPGEQPQCRHRTHRIARMRGNPAPQIGQGHSHIPIDRIRQRTFGERLPHRQQAHFVHAYAVEELAHQPCARNRRRKRGEGRPNAIAADHAKKSCAGRATCRRVLMVSRSLVGSLPRRDAPPGRIRLRQERTQVRV